MLESVVVGAVIELSCDIGSVIELSVCMPASLGFVVVSTPVDGTSVLLESMLGLGTLVLVVS